MDSSLSTSRLTHIDISTGKLSVVHRSDTQGLEADICLRASDQCGSNPIEVPSLRGMITTGCEMRRVLFIDEGDEDITEKGNLMMMFFGPHDTFVFMSAFARNEQEAKFLWEAVRTLDDPGLPLPHLERPEAPWIARRMVDPGADKPEIMPALEAVEHAIAWGWLDIANVIEGWNKVRDDL